MVHCCVLFIRRCHWQWCAELRCFVVRNRVTEGTRDICSCSISDGRQLFVHAPYHLLQSGNTLPQSTHTHTYLTMLRQRTIATTITRVPVSKRKHRFVVPCPVQNLEGQKTWPDSQSIIRPTMPVEFTGENWSRLGWLPAPRPVMSYQC